MKKKFVTTVLALTIATTALVGCGSTSSNEANSQTQEATIDDSAEAAEKEAEANEYYEAGRSFLYGTDGNKVDYEAAYNNFQQALELGKVDANF